MIYCFTHISNHAISSLFFTLITHKLKSKIMDNTAFKRLFSEGKYKEVDYLCNAQLFTEDGWSFEVHKIILAKENQYFKALFRNAKKTQTVFYVRGIKGSVLDQILCYIYARTLPDQTEINLDLLIASDFLLVDSLKLCIKKPLMDSMVAENCLLMHMVSLKINDTELLKFSYRYIQTHFQALINNNLMNFKEVAFEFLKNILNDNSLCVTSEQTVWKCMEKWVNVDPSCRLSLLPELLKCLKIEDVHHEVANEIIQSDIMSKSSLYKDWIGREYLSQSNCSLDVLKNIIRCSAGESHPPINQFQCHRHPKCLHIIAKNKDRATILYMSYDENIDLWRRVGETVPFINTRYFPVVGHKVYALDNSDNNKSMVFDLYTKQWTTMARPRIARRGYSRVKLESKIFIIGGTPEMSDHLTTSVEFYDTEQDKWFDAMSMLIPVSGYESAAASYQNKIFVVDSEINSLRRVAQVYDADLNRWSFFTPPNICFFTSCFLEYHGKLYIFGGDHGVEYTTSKVEVYDIATNNWEFITDLPAKFDPCSPIVLHDQLIVFDFPPEGFEKVAMSPVTWNEEERLWKPLDDSFLWYLDCSVDSVHSDAEISAMLKEVRDPASTFEKSPFK